MTSPHQAARRRIDGTAIDTSVLGLDLPGSWPALRGEVGATRSLVREALTSGVTTFLLGSASSAARILPALREVLSPPGPRPLYLVEWPSRAPGPGSGAPAPPTSLPYAPDEASAESILRELTRSLSAWGDVLVDWNPRIDTNSSAELSLELLGRLRDAHEIRGWATRWRPASGNPDARSSSLPPSPATSDLSLLSPACVAALGKIYSGRPGVVLATDPFDRGRLDGSRFSQTLGDRTPRSAPPDLRALHSDFDPVVRLAPLTRDRQRTLAQASIQYLLRSPWVASVLVPVSAPGRWAEMFGTLTAPPLEPETLRSLGLIGPGSDTPSPATRPTG
jgi:aryl-alcohol dehydrogenase-like predicted oxidoreductase